MYKCIFVLVDVGGSVGTWVWVTQSPEEGAVCPGARVVSDWKCYDVDAGNQTHFPQEQCTNSWGISVHPAIYFFKPFSKSKCTLLSDIEGGVSGMEVVSSFVWQFRVEIRAKFRR